MQNQSSAIICFQYLSILKIIFGVIPDLYPGSISRYFMKWTQPSRTLQDTSSSTFKNCNLESVPKTANILTVLSQKIKHFFVLYMILPQTNPAFNNFTKYFIKYFLKLSAWVFSNSRTICNSFVINRCIHFFDTLLETLAEMKWNTCQRASKSKTTFTANPVMSRVTSWDITPRFHKLIAPWAKKIRRWRKTF